MIGGDLSLAGDVLLDPVREVVRRNAIPSAAEDTEIVAGALGERAEVLGRPGAGDARVRALRGAAGWSSEAA